MARPSQLRICAALAAAAGLTLALLGPTAPAGAATPALTVDLSSNTGAFYGGANGALYALGQDGVPNDDVVAPLHMRTIAQKPDGGLQHPSGDADNVASEFFRTGGKQEFIYMQDIYAGFPYANPGLSSYQQTIAPIISQVVASPYRSKFVFVPFNEPDNIWYDLHSSDSGYASSSAQFFQDWKTIYTQIRNADPGALIAGPNTSGYDSTFMHDFLTFAKANNVLPDVTTWHELLSGWTVYRGDYSDYRSVEKQIGVSPIPINIDEYAARSDQSVPGRMIQWMSGFEDTKVDAMQAFWGITEDIQGNVVRANEANSSWWLMKWYGALTGHTLQVTPPSPNTDNTVQGIATLDPTKNQARVLLGGASGATTLALTNVPSSVFGSSVHVQVQLDHYSGWDSTAQVPPTIAEGDYPVTNGGASVQLPASTADDAYQVILTPSATVGSSAPSSPPQATRYEAENAAITDATVYAHHGLIDYPSSNGQNVGSFNKADSRLTYTVTAPVTGQYQLDIFYGSQATDLTQQIMKIDSNPWQYVTYSPTLDFSRNGKKTLYMPLSAGTHTITFGVSDPSIGNTNSDITQDAIDLTPLTAATTTTKQVAQRYEAEYADLTGAAGVATSSSGYTGTGYVASSPTSTSSTTTLYVVAPTDGYYDLSARYATSGTTAAAVTRSIDGQIASTTALAATNGSWAELPQVTWLKAGINRLTYAQAVGATSFALDRVDVSPIVGDTSALAPTTAATSGTLSGTASVEVNSNATGGKYVGNIGNGSGNTLTFGNVAVPRSGLYAVNVGYANNERPQSNTYNTDLVDRYADVKTTNSGGSITQRVYFTNTYCWSCFQQRTFYVSLTAGTNSIQFGNSQAFAPDIDSIQVAALVQPSTTVEAEASVNTLGGAASRASANSASGNSYVGFIGNGSTNTLTFNNVTASKTGTADILFRYASGETRTASLTVNGGTPVTVTFPSTGSFRAWADLDVQLPLSSGSANTVKIANATAFAPDIDKLTVAG